ncbi:uncharacterized protein [Argopecten irradians]|uniref:uncharacterized protein n=1 Tax=Argopecten irradians TaxID=31199 RepID=UPI003712ABA0
MYVLQERKNCAAAEAEADALETISAAGKSIHIPAHLNVPVVDTVLRTEKYVNSLTNIENGSLYDTREPNIENVSHYEAREPHFENMSRYEARQPNIGNVSRDEERQPNMENVSQNELRQPVMKESTVASELSQFLLKKDLIFSRLHKFDDSPENYAAWRTGFCNIMDELNVSPPEELDLLIRWLGPESVKHATSIRAASTSNPVKGLSRLWDRLNERYGSPQMVESALKTKLNNFPKITNKEFKRLYELADILSEIESAMENPTYRDLLSYFNTTAGINPIVSKLPHNIQEKWTNHAVRYRKQFDVVFPPFSCFTEFVREMSQIKNDPGFVYDNDTAKDSSIQKQDRNPVSRAPAKKRGNQSAPHVSTFKTEISPTGNMESIDSSSLCPLHHTGHSLNSCRQFRSKPIGVRRKYLKEKRYCFKCCDSTDHVYKNCSKNITCNVCQSTEHPGALHFDGGEKSRDKEPVKTVTIPHNEKVTANCTRINNARGQSKSCAKILMVNVHPTQEPQNTVKMYALLDEQNNRSLVRPAFFQLFDKKYETVNYSLSTCSGLASATGRKACDFTVSALDGSFNADLPCLLECDNIPNEREEIPTPDVALSYPHLSDLAQYIPDLDPSVEIVMLLGRDIPEVHHVQDQRIGPSGSPYAQQLHLGWTIIGETCLGTMHRPDTVNVNKTYLIKDRPSLCKPCPYGLRVKEHAPSDTTAHDECEHSIFQRTRDDEKLGLSREDQEFLKIMDRDFIKDLHGRWTAPLPFKPHRPRLPNNKSQAVKRAHILDNTLRKDPIKRAHFITFMQKLFEQKHAELAPPLHDGQECWYLPIFGVYQKRDQIRGVFDSSAKHDGLSLNNVLMSGPDMTNNLPGILLRFRREQVAVTADVQQMFYNFFDCEDHRNFLRFLWYQDNDMSKDLVEYRMCVHVFGNTPSPAVATYGLRRTACENADNFGYNMKEFVEQDFYVGDGLMSLPSAPEAIDLMKRTQQALATAGIRLHKVASNCTQVLKSFPQEDLAKDLKDLEIDTDSLPVQHSLGLSWDLESDSFLFRISPDDKPYTRRGVLSVTNSLFDPLGFIAPVAIGGKILLRSMTTGMFDWDETLPSKFYNEWERWRDSLHDLQDLRIPRQYTSSSFKECENISVHVFSDASEKAIASVGYLLTACEDGTQELGFILGKTKVAPLHTTTIPRLELCAAVLAIEIAETISEQLNLPLSIFRFYTDSKVVIGYVYNQTRRFYNYVCNRVTRIRKSSTPEQWNFVSTEHNPADQGTRPIHAKDLLESKWLHGPMFLLEGTEFSDDLVPEVSADDKEVRPEVSCLLIKAKVSGETILKRCEKFSNWHQLVTAMGTLIKLARRIGGGNLPSTPSCLESFSRAKTFILQLVQRDTFPTEIECLSSGNPCPRDSRISALNPFLDQHGLLRVGGRLKHAKIDTNEKYPIIIPSAHHISTLIVRHYHEQMKHQGRHLTEGSIRSAGFWIVGGKRLLSSIIHKCVTCRKFRGKEGNQIMSDLPKDRVVPGPPFSSVGVDVFGPWNVVARRTRGGVANSKRWAVLYTCLTTRAIHIEVVEELSTSAFINATRRFIAIRGKVTEFRSDRDTNFVGATDLMRIDAVKCRGWSIEGVFV